MKRITMFALFVILAILPCTAQQAAQPHEKRRPGPFGLLGPVRSVRDERVAVTNVNGELVEGARVLAMTISYSEDGTQQELTFYAPDGSIRSKRASLYNEDGRLLEDTSSTGMKTVYHFDNQKKIYEIIVYKPDGSVLRHSTVVRQGTPRLSETTVYDQDGRVVTKGTINSSPQSTSLESYMFTNDRVIKTESVTTQTPNGGQVTERRENGNMLFKQETIPGEKGRMERIIYNADGTILRREQYATEFDSHGNPIKISRSVAEGDSTDFKLAEVTYRTIEYYQ